jgi:uncharacterized protein YggE
VHTDLIAMLPVYEWRYQDQGGKRVGVESVRAYRQQLNVHVRTATEADARKVERLAFQKGIPDLIAVDYACSRLAGHRQRAQEAALTEARRKADLLLALFPKRPELINVHEETEVVAPRDQYVSFQNVYAEDAQVPWEERVAHIKAPKPKNTFYEGLYADLDVRESSLPMRPQFSVVSTIKLYFASPVRASAPPLKDR